MSSLFLFKHAPLGKDCQIHESRTSSYDSCQVCRVELSKDLKDVTEEELDRVVIAYEPVWAIGTGLTCDPRTAQKVSEELSALV